MTNPLRHTTILLAAVAAAVVSLVSVPRAQAAPAALQQPTSNCWLEVINDWLDNNQVDRSYAIPCYTQAIQHLNLYPDVKGYSSAIDDIQRAQLAAIHQERNEGSPSGGGSDNNNTTTTSAVSSGNGGGGSDSSGGSGGGGGGGIFGAHDATSIPLPLIVLAALAILLALAAFGTWFARRLQARRPAPAPAIAKRR